MLQARTVSESESDGGFVEFGDVDFGVSGFDGVWHTGGLWNPSRGVCADAPAAEAGGGEDSTGSGAGVVTELSVFTRVLVQGRMESTSGGPGAFADGSIRQFLLVAEF
jgi:hypothetical protein